MDDEWDLGAVSADHDFAGASDQVAGFESQDLHIELLFVGHCLTAKVVSPYGCHDRVRFFTVAMPALLETVGKNSHSKSMPRCSACLSHRDADAILRQNRAEVQQTWNFTLYRRGPAALPLQSGQGRACSAAERFRPIPARQKTTLQCPPSA